MVTSFSKGNFSLVRSLVFRGWICDPANRAQHNGDLGLFYLEDKLAGNPNADTKSVVGAFIVLTKVCVTYDFDDPSLNFFFLSTFKFYYLINQV